MSRPGRLTLALRRARAGFAAGALFAGLTAVATRLAAGDWDWMLPALIGGFVIAVTCVEFVVRLIVGNSTLDRLSGNNGHGDLAGNEGDGGG